MLTPTLKPYTKPRKTKPAPPPPDPDAPPKESLTDGLGMAIFLGVLMGAFVGVIVIGVKFFMVLAALAFVAWVARWTIRIW